MGAEIYLRIPASRKRYSVMDSQPSPRLSSTSRGFHAAAWQGRCQGDGQGLQADGQPQCGAGEPVLQHRADRKGRRGLRADGRLAGPRGEDEVCETAVSRFP